MPALLSERLGFPAGSRVAVVHADDIGMCHAANLGAFEALEAGPVTCGSVMVPCPWFPEAAARARENPALDLGVHLTLNSEWEHYRWGPVAGARSVPSLVTGDGRLYRTVAELIENAEPEDVEIEARAQIDRALENGIDVTHIDGHMGAVLTAPFLDIYAQLARDYRVPAFIMRPSLELLGGRGMSAQLERILELVDSLEADGVPVFDGFDANSLDFEPGEGLAHNQERLRKLGAGVSYLVCHPAKAGEELSAIAPEAHARDFERSFYGAEAGRSALEKEGILTVGMRPLRDLMRGDA